MGNERPTLRKIGFGQCGLILEDPSEEYAMKLCRPGFADGLWNDCLVHRRVCEAFQRERTAVLVPGLHAFIAKEDSAWWMRNANVMPNHPEFPIPCRTLVTERIRPLSEGRRDSFIHEFCPAEDKKAARACDANKDCLARVYLGRRSSPTMSSNFTLRNFNFHVDQMRSFGLPVEEYAKHIGEALAVIHWRANVTGYDIEFVLGGPASAPRDQLRMPQDLQDDPKLSTGNAELLDLAARGPPSDRCSSTMDVQLWVLDFNLCGMWEEQTALEFPDTLVNCLVEAFFENDPYYPLPLAEDDEDQQLWSVFRHAYNSKAREVLMWKNERLRMLPVRFLEACEERERKMLEMGRGHGARDQKQ